MSTLHPWTELAQLWLSALAVTALHSLWIGTLAAGIYALAERMGIWCRPQTRYRAGMALLAATAVALAWICAGELETVPALDSTVGSMIAVGSAGTSVGAAAATPALDWWSWASSEGLAWLGAVWMLGAGVSLSRTVRAWLGLRRVVHLAQPLPGLQLRLHQLQARLQMRGVVRVVCSALDHAPFVIGLLRPVIVLPASALSGLTPQQVDAVLMHELAHVRRVDLWLNLAQVVLETLVFFHPLVLWLSRRMREVREECCDDLVLQGGIAAPVYARALLVLEQRRVLSARLAPAAVGGVLLTRIERLVQEREETDGAPASAPWVALGLLLVVLTLGLHWPGMAPLSDPAHPRQVLRAQLAIATGEPVPQAMLTALPVQVPPVRVPALAEPAPASAILTDTADAAIPVPLTLPVGSPSSDAAGLEPERSVLQPRAIAQAEPADLQMPLDQTTPLIPSMSLPASVEAPSTTDAVQTPPRRPAAGAFAPAHSVMPEFPANARAAGSAGRVVLTYTLDSRGHARSVRVEFASGDVAFVSAARAALRQWRYSREDALRLGGDRLLQEFTFRLGDNEGAQGDGRCDPLLGTRVCRH